MNKSTIKSVLIDVLHDVQEAGNHEHPPLSNDVIPLCDLPNFDSKIWPIAVVLIGEKLGVDFPVDINVFKNEENCEPLNIEQITAKVFHLIKNNFAVAEKEKASAQ
ncbi:hypothetical protein NK318_01155 [Acinetobacter junii]|uniref:hypothetical protein n=1 Tax=Acinetobacter junii TaxID=40215 RepID=UPI0030A9D03E